MKKSLRSINSTAKIIECQQSRVNLDELLGLGSFSLECVSHMVMPHPGLGATENDSVAALIPCLSECSYLELSHLSIVSDGRAVG